MNSEVKTKKQMLLDAIIKNSERKYWVQRPNVAVNMQLHLRMSGTRQAFGFAKVSHPDDWDEEFGKRLAERKAASCILKQTKEEGLDLIYLHTNQE